MESGPSRFSNSYKRPVRTQAVIDQSDMYTHVFSTFTEKKVNMKDAAVCALDLRRINHSKRCSACICPSCFPVTVCIFVLLNDFRASGKM